MIREHSTGLYGDMEKLDWNHTPNPSPYQRIALNNILDHIINNPDDLGKVCNALKQKYDQIKTEHKGFDPMPYHQYLQSYLIKKQQNAASPLEKEKIEHVINLYNSMYQ